MGPGIHSGFNELVRFVVVIVLTVMIYRPQAHHGADNQALEALLEPVAEQSEADDSNTDEIVDLAMAETMVAPVQEERNTPDQMETEEKLTTNPARNVCVTRRECRYHPIIVSVADRYEVDPAMVKAIIKAESGYNPRAVSKQGATGLMQLMPRTARSLGVEDVLDPEMNIDGGVKYFKQLLDQFDGEVELALAAYNAGSQRVRKYQGVPPFKATRAYIKKVFRYYRQYRQQTGPESESA